MGDRAAKLRKGAEALRFALDSDQAIARSANDAFIAESRRERELQEHLRSGQPEPDLVERFPSLANRVPVRQQEER